ncbi:uncharacterized protein LOC117268098 isoform X1 [Epinephelus lanceolatus]|uniref:zinc finger protein 133-like n=1 Tax=Epinephelus lanceolatus TaxID=310571 RepID=UPI0014455E7D|nr:zinc finger protein 133-like [Epinephelus lanceolatus]
MDATVFELRLFIHQRLHSAAEEILGEVEKAITLALKEPQVSRSQEEAGSLRHQREKTAAELSLTSSTVEHGDEGDAPLLQENQRPSAPEESNLSLRADVTGSPKTSADVDNTNLSYCLFQTDFRICEIKEEQEQLEVDSQTQEMVFPSPEIVKSEQVQLEIQVSNELQPFSSDISPAQSENNDPDEDLVKSKGQQTRTMKRKRKKYQGQSGRVTKRKKAALPPNTHSAESEKQQTFCHLCGKSFYYIGFLMKHIKSHEAKFDCTICRMKCQSAKQLVAHLKSWHNQTCVCRFCGKICAKFGFLRIHEKTHKAEELSLTSSTVEHGDECDVPQLQENPGPSPPEEPDISLSAEVLESSQTGADLDSSNLNYFWVQTDFKMTDIKGGQEELWDDGQTQEMVFPPPNTVECEQDQPETGACELQPLSSDCSAAESKNNDNDAQLLNSKGDQTIKQKGQSVSKNEMDQAASRHNKSSAKSVRPCHFCGKGFQYIGPLMKHIRTHQQENDCTACGKTCPSALELINHVKSEHKNIHICHVCGKCFDSRRSCGLHERMHSNKQTSVKNVARHFTTEGT